MYAKLHLKKQNRTVFRLWWNCCRISFRWRWCCSCWVGVAATVATSEQDWNLASKLLVEGHTSL